MYSSSGSSLASFSSPSPSTFGTSLSLGLDPNHAVKDTPIEILSAQYTAVQDLLELNRQLIQQSNQANQALHSTLEDNRVLRKETKELSQQLHAQSSLHAMVSVLSAYDKPAKRPAELPHDVLWTWDDMKADPEAAPPAANPSRPAMNLSIRAADGTVVDSAAYSKIKSAVQTIYSAVLQVLTPADSDRPLPRWRLRNYHRPEWDKAIRELEEAHPVVGLCAYHWKAEQLFQQHISSLSNTVGKREKKSKGLARPLRTSTENLQHQSNPDPMPATSADPSAPTGTASAAQTMVPGTSAAPQSQPVQPGSHTQQADPLKRKSGALSDVDTNSDKSGTKKVRTTPLGASSQMIDDVFSIKPPGLSSKPPTGTTLATTVNVSHIQVSPTLENLEQIFSTEFSSIEEGVALTKKLKALFGKVPDLEPSANVKAFFSRIDNADPNAQDISEDDTNASWGHHQFTGGSLTIDSTLVSWAAVGSVGMACQLVAASVKTRHVAVQICAQRRLRPASYLSDIYLSRIVKKLLELAKTVDIPEDDASQVPQGLTGRTFVLKDLLVEELRSWITEHSIPIAGSGRVGTIKKPGLIEIITASGNIPSNEAIEKMVASRRRGKKAVASST